MDPTKQPAASACAACRKLKMRCVWTQSATAGPCNRCNHSGRSCFIPQAQKLGRKRGSAGRYQGADKALRNLQLALKKAEGQTHTIEPNVINDMCGILNNETPTIASSSLQAAVSPRASLIAGSSCNIGDWTSDTSGGAEPPFASQNDGRHNSQDELSLPKVPRNQRSIKSNPLWLIANSSREALVTMASSQESEVLKVGEPSHPSEDTASTFENSLSKSLRLLNASTCVSLGLNLDSRVLGEGLDAVLSASQERSKNLEYFKYRDIDRFPDVGPEFDPIDQGLVTIEGAQKLFPIYFERVNPITCILDPKLHTVEFVRSRSALLFTWVLAITAQFQPEYLELVTRLRIHGERLCKEVYTRGFKSTEIVQGYYIYLHVATPAPSYAEERTWLYTAYAFGLASSLYLDEPCRRMTRGIDPPNVTEYELLSRNRERAWLRILAWETANNALCNRVDVFPENGLLRRIETWWRDPLATSTDRYTCAFITLRQRLAILHSDLKRQADIHDPDPHWIAHTVNNSLCSWQHEWTQPKGLATQGEYVSDIYLHHVYMYARLWALSFGLSKSTQPRMTMRAVAEDCFHSAIECCEMAVRDLQKVGEQLYLMMTPIWAMACYAAVLALKLFPILYGDQPGADAQLIALLSQVALQLERAGSNPSPRFGLAALLGQHLKMILQTRLSPLYAALKQPVAHTIWDGELCENVNSCDQLAPSSYAEFCPTATDLTDFDAVFNVPIGENGVSQGDFEGFLQEFFGQRFDQ